jgi:hypothetical protein
MRDAVSPAPPERELPSWLPLLPVFDPPLLPPLLPLPLPPLPLFVRPRNAEPGSPFRPQSLVLLEGGWLEGPLVPLEAKEVIRIVVNYKIYKI